MGSLQNAFKSKKIGHAYIFIGPRGVGKTTIARILAKRLNCERPDGVEPCNECTSCLEITKGNSNDVFEIDAASNSGVDNIRELRENVKFNAMGGKYRVYILDEVHMLSGAAFNALLKTLEEPPAHVVFILATTEYHKIPETILSRCQDFHFRKVPVTALQNYIETLCEKEGLKYDSEGLFWIAKKGDGSVRDTLSFMEQAVIFTDGNLTGAKLRKMIGYHGIDTFTDFLNQLLDSSQSAQIFETLENLFQAGIDLSKFVWDFVEFLNSLLLIKDNLADRESINIPQEDLQKLKQNYRDLDREILVLLAERIFSIHEKLNLMKLRSSYEMKVYLEIQFRKLILDREKPSVSGLLAKISELTKLVQGDISHIPENLEPTKKQPSPVVESSPQKTEPTPPVLDKPKQNIELEAKPNPQKQEQAPPTKPATASPAASEDMEKLLKEKFSGMEVDPNQFKNL
ncbi:DNA polymerase III, subunit gamma and tau [Leptospira vanthielii serovar Holland str. Waz Holland = ATCC 700522]|uniref:DNA polymerase III subunit gamma/tau n=1 Tax=Leptospira vanthielii serovar Holland str. Waz Holland = ATCC 700522 TaxID=1218591 RepID=N1WER6_9LEPT|nr:DNA polymerase III, subunit gamma and tau [Leptospira vanthielii serovar Holland str. Waz Holland = ATCC 700522]